MSIAVAVVEQEAEAVSSPENSPTDVSPEVQAETELTAEVIRLWGRHQKVATATKKTRVELQAIREELGRKLAEIKVLTCKVGRRGGEWGKFLEQQAIPKATADRLIKKYAPGIGQSKNEPNEEVVTENEIEKFKESVIKKGKRLLLNEYDKYVFVVGLAEAFGVLDNYGCLIEEPEEPEDEVEPYDDEPGDDLFPPPGDRSDEESAMDDAEPALDGANDLPATGWGERKKQIVL